MKLLFTLLLITSLSLGCKKNHQTCWKCTLGTMTPGCPTTKTVCSDDGKLPIDALYDCNGNDFGGNCVKQ